MSSRYSAGPASISVSTAAAVWALGFRRAARPASFDVNGGLVGGTAGYNWQMGALVFGLEGDVDWTNIRGQRGLRRSALRDASNNWLGTARGRVGYAMDRFMPYVTGGAAFGDIKTSSPALPAATTPTPAGPSAAASKAHRRDLDRKAEYLYVDLGDTTCSAAACGVATNVDLRAQRPARGPELPLLTNNERRQTRSPNPRFGASIFSGRYTRPASDPPQNSTTPRSTRRPGW